MKYRNNYVTYLILVQPLFMKIRQALPAEECITHVTSSPTDKLLMATAFIGVGERGATCGAVGSAVNKTPRCIFALATPRTTTHSTHRVRTKKLLKALFC